MRRSRGPRGPLPISLLFPSHSGRKSHVWLTGTPQVYLQGFILCGTSPTTLQQLGRDEVPSWKTFPQGIPRAPRLLRFLSQGFYQPKGIATLQPPNPGRKGEGASPKEGTRAEPPDHSLPSGHLHAHTSPLHHGQGAKCADPEPKRSPWRVWVQEEAPTSPVALSKTRQKPQNPEVLFLQWIFCEPHVQE